MPFGFFMKNCHVENAANDAEELYLIGTSDGYDTCPMSSNILDLHISSVYTDNSDWTTSAYSLTFDSFRFRTSSSMIFKCTVSICLKDGCTAKSDNDKCDKATYNADGTEITA